LVVSLAVRRATPSRPSDRACQTLQRASPIWRQHSSALPRSAQVCTSVRKSTKRRAFSLFVVAAQSRLSADSTTCSRIPSILFAQASVLLRPITDVRSRLSRFHATSPCRRGSEATCLGLEITGPDGISKFWENAIKSGFKDHTFEIVETHMDGNQAYLLSSWTVKQVKADGAAGSMSGHTLRVLAKQGDGSWKTKVHTFIPLQPQN
jgi:hypothetical protein